MHVSNISQVEDVLFMLMSSIFSFADRDCEMSRKGRSFQAESDNIEKYLSSYANLSLVSISPVFFKEVKLCSSERHLY